MKKRNLGFAELLLYISRHKKFVLFTIILASIAAVIYSLLATQYWRSNVTFLPSETDNLMSVGSIGDLRSSIFDMGVQPASSELIMLMKSNRFSYKIIKKFNLAEYFKIRESDSLKVRDKVIANLHSKIIKFSLDEETGLISVSALTNDKYLSARIANYYCLILSEYNREIRTTKSKRTREFIENRILTIESEIDSLSLALKQFQDKYNVLDVNIQTKKIIEIYSEIISQKMITELNLEMTKQQKSENSPEIRKLKDEINAYDKKIKDMEYLDNNVSKYMLKMDNIPTLMLKLSNIRMNIEVLTTVYQFLYPQYETAKIEELREIHSLEIIDKAVPTGKRAEPKRAMICIITFFLAVIFSILTSIIIELFKDYLADKENQNLLIEIKTNFFSKHK